MRGKVACADQTIQPDGITPAWAGKRLSPVTPYNPPSDHPRMGGEKTFASRSIICMKGSPPRRRGKAHRQGREGRSRRITPAWAGKRARRPSWSYGGGDHPRMGGEKVSSFALAFDHRGSPPRGRGKGKDYATAETMQGITPAWAGKSCPARCRSQSCGDHPRVGGEKLSGPMS